MSQARILIEDYAGVTVATLMDNSILEAAKIDTLAKDLYKLVDEQNRQKLIIDLSSVKLLSSQFLGILTTVNRKALAIRGTLVLCGVRKELMKVFTMTGLDALLKIYPTDAAALESFGVRVQ